MICNPDEAGVRGNSTVAVKDIHLDSYGSSQYSFVERVCEFLERYAIEYSSGAEILQSSLRDGGPTPRFESCSDY